MHHATTAKLFQQKKAKREGEARVRRAEAEHQARLAELRAQRLQEHMSLHETNTMPPASLCTSVACPHAPKAFTRYTYDPEAVRLTMNGTTITLGDLNRSTMEAAIGLFDRTHGTRRK